MCLIAFAIDCHPRYNLVLVANRDEYRHRQTAPASFWTDAPQLLAGRDLVAGGSWLGVTRGGKIAAITNYRDPRQHVVNPPSRGALVADYLRNTSKSPAELLSQLARSANTYDGFNLIYGSWHELHYFTNRGGSSGRIKPGIHALSNHLLDSGWPKVKVARSRLEAILQQEEPSIAELFTAMSDPAPFAAETLPDTGIGPERERFLSPLFICGETYATRSTTVIMISRQGEVTFIEQNHDMPQKPPQRFIFKLEDASQQTGASVHHISAFPG